ncbi:hypothetical protein Hanom_Chr01g00051381 [Helianthus anomalus]
METCYFQDLPTISTFLLFNLSSAAVMVVVRYITFPQIRHFFFTDASMAYVQQLYGLKVLMVSAGGFRLGASQNSSSLRFSGYSYLSKLGKDVDDLLMEKNPRLEVYTEELQLSGSKVLMVGAGGFG